MITITDILEQLMRVDQQIIKLLEERTRVSAGHPLDGDQEAEIISLWLEEASERNLDEVRMERLAKGVLALSRADRE